jgi:hypothetical protein
MRDYAANLSMYCPRPPEGCMRCSHGRRGVLLLCRATSLRAIVNVRSSIRTVLAAVVAVAEFWSGNWSP